MYPGSVGRAEKLTRARHNFNLVKKIHNLDAKVPAQPGGERQMPRGNKVHHGGNLGKGKERGGSKERGRWKGEMATYDVTINIYTDTYIHTHTHIQMSCALVTLWTGMPASASRFEVIEYFIHQLCSLPSCISIAEYQRDTSCNHDSTTTRANVQWLKLIGSLEHVTIHAQKRPKLSRHRFCRAF
jgi:hypothetical protein